MTRLMTFKAIRQNVSITYCVGQPSLDQSRGLLVIVHGRSRSIKIAEAFAKEAHEGFIVLAPTFDVDNYNDFQILRGRNGPLAAAEALDMACEDAARHFGVHPAPFAIMGFSAGAQFAHRYAMRFPDRITGLVSASAGWYTMPDSRLAFPFGCAPSVDMPEGIQDLDAFLRTPTLVMVGQYDVEGDKHLRRSRAIDEAQGTNRLERARRWVEAVTESSRARYMSTPVSFEILPYCGHSASEAIHNGNLVKRSTNFLVDHRTGVTN